MVAILLASSPISRQRRLCHRRLAHTDGVPSRGYRLRLTDGGRCRHHPLRYQPPRHGLEYVLGSDYGDEEQRGYTGLFIGTVSNVGDLSKVGHLPNIEGVIVGEALLNDTFTLLEAQEVVATAERERDHDLDSPSTIQHMQSGVNIYLAAYNLSAAAQWWNEELRRAIAADNPYVEVFIPQSDIETARGDLTPRKRQAAYEKAIEQADAVVVVLDGVENESWTGFECGYTRALGKYLLGIATGPYNPQRERFEAMCDDVIQVIADGENPGEVLAAIAKEVNSRLLSDW